MKEQISNNDILYLVDYSNEGEPQVHKINNINVRIIPLYQSDMYDCDADETQLYIVSIGDKTYTLINIKHNGILSSFNNHKILGFYDYEEVKDKLKEYFDYPLNMDI